MANWLSTLPVPIREVKGSRRESYNSLSGNPTASVQLQTDWTYVHTAKRMLLGGETSLDAPGNWPYTSFTPLYCSSVEIVSDGGLYTSTDDVTLTPAGKGLLNVTYIARMGEYRMSYTSSIVYVEDLIQPRAESIPVNPLHLIWSKYDPQAPNTVQDEKISVQVGEPPNIPDNGMTLIHTIEGYHGRIIELNDDLIGTTNSVPYNSTQLNFTFPVGTLMLRNYEIGKSFSFKSFKVTNTNPPGGFNPTGKMTYTIKMFYEYKKIGWELFRKADMRFQTFEDLYNMRYAESPHAVFKPFPQSPHHAHFLAYFP